MGETQKTVWNDQPPPSLDSTGRRKFVFPAEVKGFFRRRRDFIYSLLMILFLVLPWIQIKGDQAVHIDIFNNRFVFFGTVFWAHDAPMIFFLLAIGVIGLSLVTSAFGRLWCGWACPQTVFIDHVFRRIETWIEGNYIQRIRLQKEPWSRQKVLKKTLKWFLYFIAASKISHSFVAYFIGSHNLAWMSWHSPLENWGAFLTVQVFTAAFLFNFGWFREQFCLIMCPYGRLQAALMDKHSVTVTYDYNRGEPRKGTVPKEEQGDCVNCMKCVHACPTGIDIRNGIQMECIACTACVDACDEIMEKVGKPKGLIRYTSEAAIEGGKTLLLRPRTLGYSLVLVLLVTGMVLSLILREHTDIHFLRAVGAPYTIEENTGAHNVVNHYRLYLKNQSRSDQRIEAMISSPKSGIELISPMLPIDLKPEEISRQSVFFRFPKEFTQTEGARTVEVQLRVIEGNKESVFIEKVNLVGPQ